MKKLLTILFLFTVCCVSAQNREMGCDIVRPTNSTPDDIYNSAGIQIQPMYPDGGMEGFYTYFKSKFKRQKIKDVKDQPSIKVFVSFVIEKDGSASNIKIMRSGSNDASEQIIKILKKMPKWSPGMQDGQPVRASMALPVTINFTE